MRTGAAASTSPTAPIAVAIVSWNTRDLLLKCLRALEPAVVAGLTEVWVIDNGSDDGSADAAEQGFDWAHVIRSERNIGFGAAVNLVARRTRSSWIAPANADTAVEPGALERMLETAQLDDRIGCVAPQLVLDDGSIQDSVHRFPSFSVTVAEALAVPRFAPRVGDELFLAGYWRPERPREIDWAHGAFVLIRRRAYEAVGGFDEGQWMYAEDLDICWRLRRAGWSNRYEPAARVRHSHAAATGQAFGPRVLERQYSASYSWMRRRRGAAFTVSFGILNAASCALRWALLALRMSRESVAHRRSRLAVHARLHLKGGLGLLRPE